MTAANNEVQPSFPNSNIGAVADIARTWFENPRKLKRFISRYERNEADMEDIIQDALLEAIRCACRFQGQSTMETWLYGIILNTARHHVANATRYANRTTSFDSLGDNCADTLDNWMGADFSEDPMIKLQGAETISRLMERIHTMPIELQKTFELICLQECSYVEASEAMGIPVGTVRSRLHRIRSLLKPMQTDA